MRRIIITSLTLIAAALLVVPATAGAQKRSKTPAPQITRVQPMRVAVGGTLTISGRNFKAQRRKNTVIFRASDGRTAFAKPTRATKRKLVVRVPAAVVAAAEGGQQQAEAHAPPAERARRQVLQAHPASPLSGRHRCR